MHPYTHTHKRFQMQWLCSCKVVGESNTGSSCISSGVNGERADIISTHTTNNTWGVVNLTPQDKSSHRLYLEFIGYTHNVTLMATLQKQVCYCQERMFSHVEDHSWVSLNITVCVRTDSHVTYLHIRKCNACKQSVMHVNRV